MLNPSLTGSSPFHRLDGRIKLLLTLILILTASLLPEGRWAAFLLLQSILVGGAILSRLNLGILLRRSWPVIPFLLAALPLIFTLPGPQVAAVSLSRFSLTASHTGLVRFLTIAARSFLAVQAAVILTASTPYPRLLSAMRALGLPRFLAAVIGLMGRYLFVMAEQALRLMYARAVRSGISPRTGRRTGGSLVWRARVTGGMAGRLLLGSLERADRIYAAMQARGYDGEVRGLPGGRLAWTDWALLAGMLVLMILILLFSWLI